MSGHGIPRSTVPKEYSAQALEKEQKDIVEYKCLVANVTQKVARQDFSPELLQETASLLNKNPEYYTMWNIRRRIYSYEFDNLTQSVHNNDITEGNKHGQVLQIIQLDLQFLFPLLLKFPKCYWIWHHRLWLLEQSSLYLPIEQARKIWEDELKLVGKMLARDNRNFHGWGYRRIVIENLESSRLDGKSMAQEEYDYTTKMIKTNLSNFSAWHNRTKLVIRYLDEKGATLAERKDLLESELRLIHDALFDPYDQSLWFYHQNLMCTFDPSWSARSMAPGLSVEECIAYLNKEREFIGEVLEDADDCKWAYQELIECAMIESKLVGGMSPEEKAYVNTLLQKLNELDPLRRGRWLDMKDALP